jgi:hypothetical protein
VHHPYVNRSGGRARNARAHAFGEPLIGIEASVLDRPARGLVLAVVVNAGGQRGDGEYG